jgi:hypothetical protein
MTDMFDPVNLAESTRSALTRMPGLGAGGSPGPLFPRGQANVQSMLNKYRELAPIMSQLPEPVRRSIIQYDADRVAQGSNPLTREQTLLATQAATQRQAQTEEPERSLWNLPGNIVSNLRTIVGAIPKMFDPRTYAQEVEGIFNFGNEYDKLREQGANPLEAFAQSPGVRMLPGAFIVGNITNPTELIRNPLFTALDAAPFASKAASNTATFKAAEEAARASGMPSPRPLSTVAAKSFDADGQLQTRPTLQLVQDTKVGRLATEVWGNRPVYGRAAELEQRNAAILDGRIEPDTESGRIMRRVYQLAEERMPDAMERVAFDSKIKLGNFTDMTPDELSLANELRTLQQQYAQAVRDEVGGIDYDNVTGEWFPTDQIDAIRGARSDADAVRAISIMRDEYRMPSGNVDKATFLDQLDAIDGTLTQAQRKNRLSAFLRMADAYGYDVRSARALLHGAERKRTGDYRPVYESAREAITTQEPMQRLSPLDIVSTLRRNNRHVQANILATAIADGNPNRITTALKNLQNQQNSRLPVIDDEVFLESVRSYRDRIRWDNKYGKSYTSDKAAKAAAKAESLVNKTLPGRFRDVVTDRTRSKVVELVSKDLTDADVESITKAVTEGRWAAADRIRGVQPDDPNATTTKSLYGAIEQEVAQGWRQLKDAGVDPIFKHRVGRGRANQVVMPRVGAVPNTISQVQKATLDLTPTIDDWAVYMTHQGMEVLNRQASETYIDWVATNYGRSTDELIEMFAPQANVADSTANFQQQMQDLMRGRYELFNPDEAGFSWGGTKLDKWRENQVWIPTPIANNLRRMTRGMSPFAAAFEPTTQLFRLSVIGLSPRTHINNILGGGVQVTGKTSPEVWKYAKQAWEMQKNPSLVENEALRASLGSMKREVLQGTPHQRIEAQLNFANGVRARRILDQFYEAQTRVTESGPAQTLGRTVERLMDFNGKFDDMYRIMAYLYEYDRSVKRGMTPDVARRAGEELMRKTMMDWTTHTPIERQVFRTIFPFYGFIRHSLQYVARYPVDHPLRAAVIGAFARAEEEDLGGLPLNWLSMVPIGGQDRDGNQAFLSVGSMNPFADSANMFTLAGFLSSTNPILSTAFESVGLVQGRADLFPTLRYNPETGRLDGERPNFFTALPGNIVPQVNIITSMLGVNEQFNSMVQRDPEAARRFLMSSAGLPTNFRPENVPQAFFKAEVNRFRSMNDVKNDALRTGNWSEAMRYDQLRTLLQQVRQQRELGNLQEMLPPDEAAVAEQVYTLLGLPGGTSLTSRAATTGGI